MNIHSRGGKCVNMAFLTSCAAATVSCVLCVCIGIWIIVSKELLDALVGSRMYVSVAALLIILSLIGLLMTAVAYYSANREMRCFLIAYAVACGILSILLIITAVLGFVFQDQLKDSMEFEMNGSLRHFYGDPERIKVTKAWDMLQTSKSCCGADRKGSYQNLLQWKSSKWYMTQEEPKERLIPASCCRNRTTAESLIECQINLNVTKPDSRQVYTKSCYDALKGDLIMCSSVLAIVAIANSFTLIFPAGLAVWMAMIIQK